MKIIDRLKGARKTESKEEKKAAPRAAKPVAPAVTDKGGSASGGKAKVEHGESEAPKILIRPVVSEKVSRLEPAGQYVFEVSRDANKVEIKKAIERHYRVTVSKVNIVNVSGKLVNRGRIAGKRKDWSKAYVTLKKGETLVY